LTFGKLADPRAPYFNWLLEVGFGEEISRQISALISVLNDRLTGAEVDPTLQARIKHVPQEVIYGNGPVAAADAIAAIKRVALIQDTSTLRTFIKAVDKQLEIYDALCKLVLDEIGE